MMNVYLNEIFMMKMCVTSQLGWLVKPSAESPAQFDLEVISEDLEASPLADFLFEDEDPVETCNAIAIGIE